MKNEELVTNIVCKNCRVCINTGEDCNIETKANCLAYSSALQIANEKDKQLQQYVENEVKSFENY